MSPKGHIFRCQIFHKLGSKIFQYWRLFFWEYRRWNLVLSPKVIIGDKKVHRQIDPTNFVFKKFNLQFIFYFLFFLTSEYLYWINQNFIQIIQLEPTFFLDNHFSKHPSSHSLFYSNLKLIKKKLCCFLQGCFLQHNVVSLWNMIAFYFLSLINVSNERWVFNGLIEREMAATFSTDSIIYDFNNLKTRQVSFY